MSRDRAEALRPRFTLLSFARPAAARRERWAATLIARLLHRLDVGCLRLELPSGNWVEHRGQRRAPLATLSLHRWRALRRIASGGDVGFAEGYMHGDWSSPDLTGLLDWAMQNEEALQTAWNGGPLARLARRLRHRSRANTRRGSRRNIQAHYDLGNAFYATWLDAGMNYSSALYASSSLSLEQAQVAKLDRVIALLDVKPGDHVLEIGCGWGALAERLVARHGARLTGLTLSREQRAYARNRLARTGLFGAGEILLMDYRDATGTFDAIASIEMLEAAGEDYWPVYFETLRARLKPRGVAVLQVITIDEARFTTYRERPDFIQCHIFPGGMLPTVSIIREQIAAAGLSLSSLEMFGASYAQTLAVWRERFLRQAPPIGASAAEAERFRRMWDYYLAYCEIGFRSGALDVGLYRITHGD
jgi:cyclopropane-fatty-acyl-phospholipid synthase